MSDEKHIWDWPDKMMARLHAVPVDFYERLKELVLDRNILDAKRLFRDEIGGSPDPIFEWMVNSIDPTLQYSYVSSGDPWEGGSIDYCPVGFRQIIQMVKSGKLKNAPIETIGQTCFKTDKFNKLLEGELEAAAVLMYTDGDGRRRIQ